MTLKKTAAWKWFALYVKERDKWTCVTCGKKEKGAGMGAGHFIQAWGHANTFFNIRNVHAQCSFCNGFDTTSLLRYRRFIIEKYGEGYDIFLENEAKKTKQWSDKELKELSDLYRGKYRELVGLDKLGKRSKLNAKVKINQKHVRRTREQDNRAT